MLPIRSSSSRAATRTGSTSCSATCGQRLERRQDPVGRRLRDAGAARLAPGEQQHEREPAGRCLDPVHGREPRACKHRHGARVGLRPPLRPPGRRRLRGRIEAREEDRRRALLRGRGAEDDDTSATSSGAPDCSSTSTPDSASQAVSPPRTSSRPRSRPRFPSCASPTYPASAGTWPASSRSQPGRSARAAPATRHPGRRRRAPPARRRRRTAGRSSRRRARRPAARPAFLYEHGVGGLDDVLLGLLALFEGSHALSLGGELVAQLVDLAVEPLSFGLVHETATRDAYSDEDPDHEGEEDRRQRDEVVAEVEHRRSSLAA